MSHIPSSSSCCSTSELVHPTSSALENQQPSPLNPAVSQTDDDDDNEGIDYRALFDTPATCKVHSIEFTQPDGEKLKFRFSLHNWLFLNEKSVALCNRHVALIKSKTEAGIVELGLIPCPIKSPNEIEPGLTIIEMPKNKELTLGFREVLGQTFPDIKHCLKQTFEPVTNVPVESADTHICPAESEINTFVSLALNQTVTVEVNLDRTLPPLDLSPYKAVIAAPGCSNQMLIEVMDTTKTSSYYENHYEVQLLLYDAFKISPEFLEADYRRFVQFKANFLKDQRMLTAIREWQGYKLEQRSDVFRDFIDLYCASYGSPKPSIIFKKDQDLEFTKGTFVSPAECNTDTNEIRISEACLQKMHLLSFFSFLFHELTHSYQHKGIAEESQAKEAYDYLPALMRLNDENYVDGSERDEYYYATQPNEVQAYANQSRFIRFFLDEVLKEPSLVVLTDLYQDLKKIVDYAQSVCGPDLNYYTCVGDAPPVIEDEDSDDDSDSDDDQTPEWVTTLIKKCMPDLGMDPDDKEQIDKFKHIVTFLPSSKDLDFEASPPTRRQTKWLLEAVNPAKAAEIEKSQNN